MIRLFDLWGLSVREQAQLLGYSPNSQKTIRRLRNGAPLANRQDLLDRVALLLSIHKALRALYPENPELTYGWIKMHNQGFECRKPLDVMLDGYAGLLTVRRHLAHRCMR